MIQIISLSGSLADSGKDGVSSVSFGDVIDQFHNQYGLADTGAAEEADFASLGVWRKKVDDLDGTRRIWKITFEKKNLNWNHDFYSIKA